MKYPIYSNEEHKLIVEGYINMCKQFAEDVSTKSKYKNFLDVLDLIVEYHNGYGEGLRENNYYDWLTIIPINLSVSLSGFFAGIESKRNMATIRAYKVVLNELLHETVGKLDNLEPTND